MEGRRKNYSQPTPGVLFTPAYSQPLQTLHGTLEYKLLKFAEDGVIEKNVDGDRVEALHVCVSNGFAVCSTALFRSILNIHYQSKLTYNQFVSIWCTQFERFGFGVLLHIDGMWNAKLSRIEKHVEG